MDAAEEAGGAPEEEEQDPGRKEKKKKKKDKSGKQADGGRRVGLVVDTVDPDPDPGSGYEEGAAGRQRQKGAELELGPDAGGDEAGGPEAGPAGAPQRQWRGGGGDDLEDDFEGQIEVEADEDVEGLNRKQKAKKVSQGGEEGERGSKRGSG